MSAKREDYLLIVYLLLPLLVYSQSCDQNPVIFNFGDSNSDTGGYVAERGKVFLPPYGRKFFHRLAGRACDGRLVIDFLCESLNTSFLWPYLESLGPNFTNGANFAIVGSSILPRYEGLNLAVQVSQFMQFRTGSLKLIEQGYKNLVGVDGFKNALYIIDIGGNDLQIAVTEFPYSLAVQSIPSFVAEIEYAILKLYESGGKNFWIPNSGPIGCLPALLATDTYNASDLDQYGCVGPFNNVTQIFNKQLLAMCEELRPVLKNATIVYVDIYAIKYDLIANATSYGLVYPLTACCGYGGPPYNFNDIIACGLPGYNVCPEELPYVSWDGLHYTEVANAITAAKILTANYNTPPLSFDFFVSPSCNQDDFGTVHKGTLQEPPQQQEGIAPL